MVYDEIITCPNCSDTIIMSYTEGSLGSLGFEGKCSCGEKHFVGLSSLELRFHAKEQWNMSNREMLQVYIKEKQQGKINYPKKETVIRNLG